MIDSERDYVELLIRDENAPASIRCRAIRIWGRKFDATSALPLLVHMMLTKMPRDLSVQATAQKAIDETITRWRRQTPKLDKSSDFVQVMLDSLAEPETASATRGKLLGRSASDDSRFDKEKSTVIQVLTTPHKRSQVDLVQERLDGLQSRASNAFAVRNFAEAFDAVSAVHRIVMAEGTHRYFDDSSSILEIMWAAIQLLIQLPILRLGLIRSKSHPYIRFNLTVLSNAPIRALELFAESKAIELAPDLAFLYRNRAGYLTRKRRFDEALQDLEKAQTLEPAHFRLYFRYGDFYLYQANPESVRHAIDFLQKGLVIVPLFNAYLTLGVALLALGETEVGMRSLILGRHLPIESVEIKSIKDLLEQFPDDLINPTTKQIANQILARRLFTDYSISQ